MKPVSCSAMLGRAEAEGYAIPQFNINGLEWCKKVLEVCEELRAPVILGTSIQAVKSMGGYHTVVQLVLGLMQDLNISVPVAPHLDHGTYDACLSCIEAGYSSVMFDGSKLPFPENLARTEALAALCRKSGASLEAEVGTIGSAKKAGTVPGELADPEQCRQLSQAGITMLAAGIGNIHGVYPACWPGLNWSVLTSIKAAVGRTPLVLHGGSGIPDEMLTRAISMGVGKININTECQIAYMQAVRRYFETDQDKLENGHFVRKLAETGVEAMAPVLRQKIEAFGCAGKG